MNPNFAEANEAASQHLATVTIEQEGQTEFTPSAFIACPLTGAGTLKRAVDVYHGPDGDGYVVRFMYELNGQCWCRCEARGSQSYRGHNWMRIPTL